MATIDDVKGNSSGGGGGAPLRSSSSPLSPLMVMCDRAPLFSTRHVLMLKCDPVITSIRLKSTMWWYGLNEAHDGFSEWVGKDYVFPCPKRCKLKVVVEVANVAMKVVADGA